MHVAPRRDHRPVHCRTGSLENTVANNWQGGLVHCRTGSLEMMKVSFATFFLVHCRTGSLETKNW